MHDIHVMQQTSAGDMRFRNLLERLPAAAYTCDADGLITYYNKRAETLWGREPKLNDSQDRYCGSYRLYATDGAPVAHDQCWMALSLRTGKEYSGREIIIERPDGARWTALAHAYPFYDESGAVSGAVNVLVDVSERDVDHGKNEFVAMLAHELRKPLALLRTGLKTMRLMGNTSVVVAEAVDMMQRQLGHASRMIDELLDLARIAQGKLTLCKEQLSLAAVVQQAIDECRPCLEAAGHELAVILPAEPVTVNADERRLRQVFAKLLDNAAKYSASDGHIQVIVEPRQNDVLVKVKDNGIGIAAERLPGLFTFSAERMDAADRPQGGLGIGLPLASELVAMHGGEITAYSRGVGRGSEFVVYLPVVAAMPEQRGRDAAAAIADGTVKYRILIVDDNEDSAISLCMMLKLLGHDTRMAHDGLKAVDVALAFRPEVVLIDINLPRLDGYQVCRRIREQPWGAETFLIALTAWDADVAADAPAQADFGLHMLKPVDPDALEILLADLATLGAA